jgi:hypothetical protein
MDDLNPYFCAKSHVEGVGARVTFEIRRERFMTERKGDNNAAFIEFKLEWHLVYLIPTSC